MCICIVIIPYPARSFNTFSKIVKKIFLTWVKRRTQLKSALKFLPSFQVSANFLKEKKYSKSIIKNFSRAVARLILLSGGGRNAPDGRSARGRFYSRSKICLCGMFRTAAAPCRSFRTVYRFCDRRQISAGIRRGASADGVLRRQNPPPKNQGLTKREIML